ncbi:MAG: hypothetical protein QXI19_12405, partial [Candidatus Caldarchaeum sp.]
CGCTKVGAYEEMAMTRGGGKLTAPYPFWGLLAVDTQGIGTPHTPHTYVRQQNACTYVRKAIDC